MPPQLIIDSTHHLIYLANADDRRLLGSVQLAMSGGCVAPHKDGVSVFLSGKTGNIYHYEFLAHEFLEARRWQLARVINTSVEVKDCMVWKQQLVFADNHGVYQTGLSIEADETQRWLTSLPVDTRGPIRLVARGDRLVAQHQNRTTEIDVEVDAIDDHVATITAIGEIDLPADANETVLLPWISDRGQLMVFQSERVSLVDAIRLDPGFSLLPIAGVKAHGFLPGTGELFAAITAPDQVSLSVSEHNQVQPWGQVQVAAGVSKLCLGMSGGQMNLITISEAGAVRRFLLNDQGKAKTIQTAGEFNLDRPATDCFIDPIWSRLYLLEATVGIWVFDLSAEQLLEPRQVTTNKIVDSLSGLAIYGGKDGYLLSQSVGDGCFLVFERPSMTLVARFKVGADLPKGIDGVHESAGYVATARPQQGLPEGLLVINDQRNRLPTAKQNLKLVDWRQVQAVIKAQALDE